MRRLKLWAFLLALCLSLLVTGLLIYFWQQKLLEAGPKVTVVVAAENIAPRTVISARQVKEVTIPAKYRLPGALASQAQVIGRVSRESIFAGEQVIGERLVQGKDKDGLAPFIPAGHRAVALKVDHAGAVAGYLRPGDRVDMQVFLRPPAVEKEKVVTVLANIEVLDVVQNDKRQPEAVVLLLPAEKCEEVFYACEAGKVKLALRPLSEKSLNNRTSGSSGSMITAAGN